MINFIINKLKYRSFKKKWRNVNSNNLTLPKKIFKLDLVEIGDGTYGTIDIETWGHPNEKLIIGRYCSIAKEVKFLLGGNHDFDHLSTYPFPYYFEKKLKPGNTAGPIIVEDGAWIGTHVLILSGVTIGKGAIIGAGCVVSKDVPRYAIVVGNPMKIVKYRFTEELRNRLNNIDYYSFINKEFYIRNHELLRSPLSEDLINILEQESARIGTHGISSDDYKTK